MPGIGISNMIVSGGGGGACTSRKWIRPTEWLDLPATSDGDNVTYVLHAVYENEPNWFSVYATTSSGVYTVDLYNDTTAVTTHSSGAQADFDLSYAKGTDEFAARGYKQVIIKITGLITAIDFYRRHPDAESWYMTGVLACKITSQTITTLVNLFNYSTSRTDHSNLEEFEYVGTCNATSLSGAFKSKSLGSVKGTFTSVTNADYCFMHAPQMDLSEFNITNPSAGVNVQQMFESSIMDDFSYPTLLTKGKDFYRMWNNSKLLYFGTPTAPIQLDTATTAQDLDQMFFSSTYLKQVHVTNCAPTTLANAFRNCYNLRIVSGINCTNVTTTTNMFLTTPTLSWLEITNMGVSFSVDQCNFSRAGLVNIFNDLPTATATITVTNNPGTSDLTADDLAIATDKNWTVTS